MCQKRHTSGMVRLMYCVVDEGLYCPWAGAANDYLGEGYGSLILLLPRHVEHRESGKMW